MLPRPTCSDCKRENAMVKFASASSPLVTWGCAYCGHEEIDYPDFEKDWGPPVEIVSGGKMKCVLDEVYKTTPKHIIGVERYRVEAGLKKGGLLEGWSVTFYDDDDEDKDGNPAYCLAWVRDGELVITHITYGLLSDSLN